MFQGIKSWSNVFFAFLLQSFQDVLNIGGYRVVYDPVALVKALDKYNMQKRIDTINAQYGPIDGVVGSFNISSGEIMVDVEEIIQMNIRLGRSAIDEQLTKTLAHELRHRWQLKHYGKFMMLWDKIVLFFLVELFAWWAMIIPSAKYLWNDMLKGEFLEVVVDGVITIALVLITLFAASLFSYYLCWVERDARKFANKVVNDPAWQEVFKVY